IGIAKQRAVRIAIKRNTHVETPLGDLALGDKVRHLFRMQRATILVDVLSIRRGVQKGRADLERSEQFWGFGGRRAVGAIDRRTKPAQVCRNTSREPANVSVAQSFVTRKAGNFGCGIRRWSRIRLEQRKNLFLKR